MVGETPISLIFKILNSTCSQKLSRQCVCYRSKLNSGQFFLPRLILNSLFLLAPVIHELGLGDKRN